MVSKTYLKNDSAETKINGASSWQETNSIEHIFNLANCLLKRINKSNIDLLSIGVFLILLSSCNEKSDSATDSLYITNQSPLIEQAYMALPIGAIKPQGMLLEMLEIQKDGLTGNLDSIYNIVCGDNNGWLGGTGDGWERGPYWLDGLVPLAYILDDQILKDKAQKWIEWSIANQRDDGYFGPVPLADGTPKIPGTQQGNREDWWPKMVMLKVLQQYYSATNDERVINLMSNYFRYQLNMLPETPLNNWTFWGNRRGGDNLALVYWLYNITKEEFLLDLGELIHSQTYDWTEVFSDNTIRVVNPLPRLHCVNVAQGLKEPIVYYQQHPDQKYLDAVDKGLEALKDVHGFVNGMYGGDERLHGNDPTQGSELCSAVEMMYSFEISLPITGKVAFADHLEKIAYNVLPTQHNDDFTRKQYFQQANQVQITDETRNFFNDNKGRLVYGTTTGYPCCLANMHQGWPKFVQNLWYATKDKGVAALVYGPSEVIVKVAKGQEIKIIEETDYPFKDNIRFRIETTEAVGFPFHLRIPTWCKTPIIKINNERLMILDTLNNIAIINRKWSSGDLVELTLPMDYKISRWHENSIGIERGPLVYALKIDEDWQEKTREDYDDTFWEVYPKTPWNYAVLENELNHEKIEINIKDEIAVNPWNLENAPIVLKTQGVRLPRWQLDGASAAKTPLPSAGNRYPIGEVENIELIPYGCTTLRISQFPVMMNRSR